MQFYALYNELGVIFQGKEAIKEGTHILAVIRERFKSCWIHQEFCVFLKVSTDCEKVKIKSFCCEIIIIKFPYSCEVELVLLIQKFFLLLRTK